MRVRPANQQAFTLVEMLIASIIIVMVVGAFAVFMQATGVALVNVTSQSTFNQEAGTAAEMIMSRVRLANTASNSSSGEILTLSFDDDPDTDSDGDQTAWNDIDHYEQFQFLATDGNATTLEDNQLVYKETLGGSSRVLVRGGVRKLPGEPVFLVTNQATVVVNFGLLATNENARSQAIEIRTKGRLRNRIE